MFSTMPYDSDHNAGQPSAPAGNSPASAKRILVGAGPLDTVTFDEAVSWTVNYIEKRGNDPPARISCPTAFLVVLADADQAFADIIRASNLVVVDGKPLVWAASLLGTPLPSQIRGVDLMESICAAGAAREMSLYILGGVPGAAESAAERLLECNPGLRVAGIDCPPVG